MDKEILELLNRIKELTNDIGSKASEIHKMFEKELVKPCEIRIKKERGIGAKTYIKGSRLSLLIALASLEKNVLEQLNCDEMEFDFIKNTVGSKVVENNE